MRTVLVTGANGFVGRHLCLFLSGRRDVKVIAGLRGALPAELEGRVEARRIGDLAAPPALGEALRGIDAVVHLAARVHVMHDLAEDPLAQYRRVNTEAALSLARAAARHGVTRFAFLSTVKVNGERTTVKPFSDEDSAAPADPYAVSKWEAEQGLGEIASATGLEVVILRPPLVYGPCVKGNFLRLLRLVRSGAPLPLAGVANSRSMIYVGNLASAIERAVCVEPAVRGTFLVSDGADLSTPQLVRMIAAAMGRPARLFAVPSALIRALGRALGKGDEMMRMIESLRVDCSGIKHKLQWAAPFTVEQGLKETTEWFARTRPAA
jgi:nucleoside-diphosphate-sugar epimerase